jgi:predicted transcriptional regulator
MKREALAEVAADIVISYVSNRKVPISDIGILIGGVCGALSALGPPIVPATAPPVGRDRRRRKRREAG